jgi:hypothetical protein
MVSNGVSGVGIGAHCAEPVCRLAKTAKYRPSQPPGTTAEAARAGVAMVALLSAPWCRL